MAAQSPTNGQALMNYGQYRPAAAINLPSPTDIKTSPGRASITVKVVARMDAVAWGLTSQHPVAPTAHGRNSPKADSQAFLAAGTPRRLVGGVRWSA
jgi:hypothetical protein